VIKLSDISLYLHVPFCPVKCPYCDFYSGLAKALGVEQEAYFKALGSELDQHLDQHPDWQGRRLRSVYFGGGTPGMIEPWHYEPLLKKIDAAFSGREGAELTLEINPGTTTERKINGFVDLGFNRYSLGVQSFNDRLLKVLGRNHSGADSRKMIERLKQRLDRPECVSLDLIFAVPTQTMAEWSADLEQTLALRPGHISLYGLTYHQRTEFFEWRREGRIAEVDEDVQCEMYTCCRKRLASAGYRHYEISNWALPGCESRHNSAYWEGGDVLGLGAAAHSHVDGVRFWNPADGADYIAAMNDGRAFARREEALSERSRLGERVMLGLRLVEGFSLSEFNRASGEDFLSYYETELGKLQDDGLIVITDDCARLTDRGLLLADRVMSEFF
jgi:oxygen-independent coproporphyrinogen-3 oxidase